MALDWPTQQSGVTQASKARGPAPPSCPAPRALGRQGHKSLSPQWPLTWVSMGLMDTRGWHTQGAISQMGGEPTSLSPGKHTPSGGSDDRQTRGCKDRGWPESGFLQVCSELSRCSIKAREIPELYRGADNARRRTAYQRPPHRSIMIYFGDVDQQPGPGRAPARDTGAQGGLWLGSTPTTPPAL